MKPITRNLARTSHQLPAAVGDAPHPAVFSRFGVLDVLSSTTPRPSGRKPHWARHVADLATKAGEKCGLVITGLAILVFAAVVTAGRLTADTGAPPQETAEGPAPATQEPLPEFQPTERLPADSAVAFPTDI